MTAPKERKGQQSLAQVILQENVSAKIYFMLKKQIIIITGPAGLSALHAFAQAILLDDSIERTFELVCFEKQKALGGQWCDSAEGMPNVSLYIQFTLHLIRISCLTFYDKTPFRSQDYMRLKEGQIAKSSGRMVTMRIDIFQISNFYINCQQQ